MKLHNAGKCFTGTAARTRLLQRQRQRRTPYGEMAFLMYLVQEVSKFSLQFGRGHIVILGPGYDTLFEYRVVVPLTNSPPQ